PTEAFRDCTLHGKPADADEEDEAKDAAEEAVDPFPEEDELEAGERHSGGASHFAILRRLPVEVEFVLPICVGEWRDRAADRLPLGDRQAALGQAGDAADNDH